MKLTDLDVWMLDFFGCLDVLDHLNSFNPLLESFLPDFPRSSPFFQPVKLVRTPRGRDVSGVLCGGTEPRADGSVLAW